MSHFGDANDAIYNIHVWLLHSHSEAHNPRSHLKPISHEAEVEEAMSEEDEEGDQGEVEELAEHEPAEVDVVSGDKYLFD